MRTFIFVAVVFLIAPALRAQQVETKENPPQAVPQETTQDSSVRNAESESIKPGHPLDPADVDILTGKRDREIEASRYAEAPIMSGYYGAYGNSYAMNGRRGAILDLPLLPLRRISNPFFFLNVPPSSFGRGRFRARR